MGELLAFIDDRFNATWRAVAFWGSLNATLICFFNGAAIPAMIFGVWLGVVSCLLLVSAFKTADQDEEQSEGVE